MIELVYTLDQEKLKGKLYLIVKIQDKGSPKRFLYRDSLLSSAKGKEREAVAFLIREELSFLGISPLNSQADTLHFNRVRIAAAKSKEAILLLTAAGKLTGKEKLLVPEPSPPKLQQEKEIKEVVEVEIDPFPVLALMDRTGAFADLWMDYGDRGKIAFHDTLSMSWRSEEKEKSWEKDLFETDFIKKIVDSSHYYCPMDKVGKSLSFLLDVGWTITDHQERRVVRQGKADVSLGMEKETVLVRADISYETHQASLQNVLGAFNRRERFIDLTPNTVGLIDHEAVEKQWGDLASQEITAHGVSLKKHSMGIIQPLLENPEVTRDFSISQLAEGITYSPAAETFSGILHNYQQRGVDWLAFLHKFGFHGLLADEMGLGKTVQVLAFLSLLQSELPVLIVMPTSLLFNWRREFEKFLPQEQVYVHAGPDREKDDLVQKRYILTSYALLRHDASLLQSIDYEAVILDEAQYIKNADSLSAKCAFSLKAKFRLAISGTPIENRWEDLWSIFHFLMPQLLGERKEFSARLSAAHADERYALQIKKKVRPFILRRRKEELIGQLPPKQEQIEWVEMGEAQRSTYEEWLFKHRSGLLKKIKEDGLSAHRMEILEAILRLRQICCHPLLVDSSLEETASGKLERLISDLEEVISQGRKALVYSQFTQMLHLIEKEAKARNWPYLYLDGSTKDRESVVSQFQEDPSMPLFLISLKAGGVGLNLTAADYVFIFDPWWNEAVEAQAIDRAHRIGRSSMLIAKRYVTVLSIEEKMMHLKKHKSSLSSGLLDFEQELTQLSLQDLCDLIS